MRKWIATLLGAGFLPGAPGTWGSAATCVLLFFLVKGFGNAAPFLLGGLIVFSILSVIVGNHAVEDFGKKDPGPFVLDEAAGICLSVLFVPIPHGLLVTLIAGFIAFRVFDVTKPPPARQLERLPGGWGILLDDLAAAVYANLVCQLAMRLI